MRAKVLWMGLVLGLVLPVVAGADVVRELHSAQVPVTSQSSKALASAAQDALGQVLVKVSGSSDALSNPVVVGAMAEARSHVQQYAFVREEGPDAGLAARFEFDASYINRLVGQARLPLWTANRPRVLVWAAAELDGVRQFISLDGTPELAAELLAEFDRRGVPAQLPLFDLADATAIAVEDVWSLDAAAVTAASARYDVENILFGRVVSLSTGDWAGDWSYMYQKYRLDRAAQAAGSRGFARQGVNLVAESMASRYAVATSGADQALVMMSVIGVREFSDYAQIVSWLEGLELIEHANVQRISGDLIELGLVSQAEAAQLATIIELNERLQPQLANNGQTAINGRLEYQWQN